MKMNLTTIVGALSIGALALTAGCKSKEEKPAEGQQQGAAASCNKKEGEAASCNKKEGAASCNKKEGAASCNKGSGSSCGK